MSFLVPAALWFAALSAPILLLYMLKLRRPRRVVSSTLLWQQTLRDLEANVPWQRLRRQLLLLLQLLALLLLVFGLAQPVGQPADLPRIEGRVTVLLDASASMQATDVAPSRFEAGRAAIARMIGRMGARDTLALIAVGELPRLVTPPTSDPDALTRALRSAQVTAAEADWEAAYALAASISRGETSAHTTIVVSDGGMPPVDPSLDLGRIEWISVGASAENQAIAALALQAGARGVEAFVRVANPGQEAASGLLTLRADGVLFDARTLQIGAGGQVAITMDDLPVDTRAVEARIERSSPDSGADWLSVDNVAWAVTPAGERKTGLTGNERTALLVTAGNAFLERAIDLLPDVQAVTVPVSETLPPETSVLPFTDDTALYVFDGIVPAQLPTAGALLFVAPPHSTELFDVSGVTAHTRVVRIEPDSALLQHVEWDNVHMARARVVSAGPWARTVIEAEGGPLLLAGTIDGRRVAILSLDLHDSDLPLQVAFPVLVSNLVHWLIPNSIVRPLEGKAGESVTPGAPVQIDPPPSEAGDEQRLVVVGPAGERWVMEDEHPILFTETHAPGLYQIERMPASGTEQGAVIGAFAVNLFSEIESEIRPQTPQLAREAASAGIVSTVRAGDSQREWWRWAIAAALIVLTAEWAIDKLARSGALLGR